MEVGVNSVVGMKLVSEVNDEENEEETMEDGLLVTAVIFHENLRKRSPDMTMFMK